MSQIATSIEQSKRLLAAGLDPESADMKHTRLVIEADGEGYFSISHGEEFHIEVGNARFRDEVPAWSLSRLWELNSKSYYRLSCPSSKSPEEVIEALVLFICSPDFSL